MQVHSHMLPLPCITMGPVRVIAARARPWIVDRTDIFHHLGSLHPIGTNAHATLSTPLSVASRLNCAAAFLVSCVSSLIPISPIYLLVSGATGYIPGPNPSINKSGFGHTNSNNPHAPRPVSHCPLLFKSRPRSIHGRQVNASPDTSSKPKPPVILTPLSRWKPSERQASMVAVGAGALAKTSMAPKSVWVDSVEAGPRSVVLGGEEAGRGVGAVVERGRA